MHCRERGAMLAAVWNTQLALTDMDQQQLKMQMSEQAAVQERLQVCHSGVCVRVNNFGRKNPIPPPPPLLLCCTCLSWNALV